VLPQAVGGIVTGATLATARAAGETAPLLFTSALYSDSVSYDPREPMASIPMFIFTSAEQADPVLHQQAWGAAAVLIGIILVASLIYLVGCIGVTMVCNVPLNNALQNVTAESRTGTAIWNDYLRRWTRWNHVRTASCIAAAALFVAALLRH
jgi:hypothetical protein